MRVSEEFRASIYLNEKPGYRIAQVANLDPSVLSKLLHNITRIKPMDERVLRVAKVLGLKPEKCFDKRA